jgi:hypothetical protein
MSKFTCDQCSQEHEVCNCFSPIPKKQRVLALLADDPGMSDRTIAAECGVSNVYVSRLRASAVNQLTADDEVEVKRRGRDGKNYPMPTRKKEPKLPPPSSDTMTAASLFHIELAIGSAKEVAAFASKVKASKPLVDAVRATIDAWTAILNQLVGEPR